MQRRWCRKRLSDCSRRIRADIWPRLQVGRRKKLIGESRPASRQGARQTSPRRASMSWLSTTRTCRGWRHLFVSRTSSVNRNLRRRCHLSDLTSIRARCLSSVNSHFTGTSRQPTTAANENNLTETRDNNAPPYTGCRQIADAER